MLDDLVKRIVAVELRDAAEVAARQALHRILADVQAQLGSISQQLCDLSDVHNTESTPESTPEIAGSIVIAGSARLRDSIGASAASIASAGLSGLCNEEWQQKLEQIANRVDISEKKVCEMSARIDLVSPKVTQKNVFEAPEMSARLDLASEEAARGASPLRSESRRGREAQVEAIRCSGAQEGQPILSRTASPSGPCVAAMTGCLALHGEAAHASAVRSESHRGRRALGDAASLVSAQPGQPISIRTASRSRSCMLATTGFCWAAPGEASPVRSESHRACRSQDDAAIFSSAQPGHPISIRTASPFGPRIVSTSSFCRAAPEEAAGQSQRQRPRPRSQSPSLFLTSPDGIQSWSSMSTSRASPPRTPSMPHLQPVSASATRLVAFAAAGKPTLAGLQQRASLCSSRVSPPRSPAMATKPQIARIEKGWLAFRGNLSPPRGAVPPPRVTMISPKSEIQLEKADIELVQTGPDVRTRGEQSDGFKYGRI